MTPLPTFLVIGAAKAGTTSLYHYLTQHPSIYLSKIKEPEYFAYWRGDAPSHKEVITDWSKYKALFAGANEQQIGEVSPAYLYFPYTSQDIKARLGPIKIIAMFRHPIERAYSHYIHDRRSCVEPHREFELAVEAEIAVINELWRPDTLPRPYLRFSLYGQQIGKYYREFGEST